MDVLDPLSPFRELGKMQMFSFIESFTIFQQVR